MAVISPTRAHIWNQHIIWYSWTSVWSQGGRPAKLNGQGMMERFMLNPRFPALLCLLLLLLPLLLSSFPLIFSFDITVSHLQTSQNVQQLTGKRRRVEECSFSSFGIFSLGQKEKDLLVHIIMCEHVFMSCRRQWRGWDGSVGAAQRTGAPSCTWNSGEFLLDFGGREDPKKRPFQPF